MDNITITGKVITGLGMGEKTGLKTANLDVKIIKDKNIKIEL